MGRLYEPRERLAVRARGDGRTPGKRRLRKPLQFTPDFTVPEMPSMPALAGALSKPPWTAEASMRAAKAARVGDCPQCGGPSPAGRRGPIPICAECAYKRHSATAEPAQPCETQPLGGSTAE